jgi:SAM-dependent methyltransferase
MQLNNWSKAEVQRAESTWGQKVHPYSKVMFDFAIEGCKSWLDLGCGFGRFLNYLIDSIDEDIDYVGYDSSPDMVKRNRERFPEFAHRIFQHDITSPILNRQESIICSAVLIHITQVDQDKVLNNILAIRPRKISFDINIPGPKDPAEFEKRIKCSEGLFRMTWQQEKKMSDKVIKMFKGYNLTFNHFPLSGGRRKGIYMLEKAK